jgi:DNA-binding transcriptional regulator YiaG
MTPSELKAWRRRLGGVSQPMLAKRLGVGTSTVSHWEQGRNPIPAYLEFALRWLEHNRREMSAEKRYPT